MAKEEFASTECVNWDALPHPNVNPTRFVPTTNVKTLANKTTLAEIVQSVKLLGTKCNVVAQLVLLVILSPAASPTTSDVHHLPTHSRKHRVAQLKPVKEDFVFDHAPKSQIVNVARSVLRTDVVCKLA